jgi:hypothetical protein
VRSISRVVIRPGRRWRGRRVLRRARRRSRRG